MKEEDQGRGEGIRSSKRPPRGRKVRFKGEEKMHVTAERKEDTEIRRRRKGKSRGKDSGNASSEGVGKIKTKRECTEREEREEKLKQ